MFSQELYSVLIPENVTVGSEVIHVTASDSDDGINSELTYALSGGQGHFQINRTTGTCDFASRQETGRENEEVEQEIDFVCLSVRNLLRKMTQSCIFYNRFRLGLKTSRHSRFPSFRIINLAVSGRVLMP